MYRVSGTSITDVPGTHLSLALVVIARRDNASAIGAEGSTIDSAFMPLERGEELAGGDLPDARGLVAACGDDAGTIGAECSTPHRSLVRERLTHAGIPDTRCPIAACRDDASA